MTGARVGVVVLDHGRPEEAERAARSAADPGLDVRVLLVENGAGVFDSRPGRLRLVENRGFSGGMNAGLRQLLDDGCDRVLLLNNDARLETGCLRRLAEALDDPRLAAVGPVVVRDRDGKVESRGVSVSLRTGRVRLVGHGQEPPGDQGLLPVTALSGAVMMLRRDAVERVGLLDESYFFSFEDVDFCLRARRAGFALGVVSGARARHAGSLSLGRASPERYYYAARNHVRLAESHLALGGAGRWLRRAAILGLNLAAAARQGEAPRAAAARAVLSGFKDACSGRYGPRAG